MVQLHSIVDIDAKKLAEAEAPEGLPRFNSFEELLKSDSRPDVVVLATPNGLHCPQALMALDAGCNVVIEKPMGLTKQECEEVVFKSLQTSKKVFVVKQNRYSPPSKWLKEIVTNKVIGDTLMVQINCFWNRDSRYYKPGGWKGTKSLDGGVLFTQFSHFIDIMYWVFGDIQNISGRSTNFVHADSTEFDDSGFANFEFVNGGIGSINYSTAVWNTNMESSVTVIGSKGALKIGGQYMNDIEYLNIDGYEKPDLPATNPPNNYGDFMGSAANHAYVIDNVVNTLNGKDTITANALEGMKVVDIIERIYSGSIGK